MTMERMLEIFEENGYEWSLSKREDHYHFSICRPEWVTYELAQSRPLPSAKGDTPFQVVRALFELYFVTKKVGD